MLRGMEQLDRPDFSALARWRAAQRKEKTVACRVCGQPVTGRGRITYCSPACASKAYYQRDPERRRAQLRAAYHRRKEHSSPPEPAD